MTRSIGLNKKEPQPERAVVGPQFEKTESVSRRIMDLLDQEQYLSATMFSIFQLAELVIEAKKAPMDRKSIGIMPMESWFTKLDTAQRSQVIDYFNSILEQNDFVLNWFAHGSRRGYMFERLSHPAVTS